MSSPCISDGGDTRRVSRRKRELSTVAAMIRMYCRGHHRAQSASPCLQCTGLLEYATRRLERCVFGDAKPTCANCTVHCFSAAKREQVSVVMRWAGPRMLLHHPLLAILHLPDGRRPVPPLPARDAQRQHRDALPEHTTQG
jgi:hypothetical protein